MKYVKMIYLIVLGKFLQYFSEFIDFVFTPLCEKKGLMLSRKGARGKGSGLIIINMKYV